MFPVVAASGEFSATFPSMSHYRLERALAGLQAGVLGGASATIFLVIVSALHHRPWWMWPNVLATTFYGGRALSSGPDWHTVSGIALELLMGGVAGALFGTTFPGVPTSARLMLLGLFWGLAWHYLCIALFRRIAPLVVIYSPRYAWIVANLIYGASLGRMRVAEPVPD